jgi:hypothetical protein
MSTKGCCNLQSPLHPMTNLCCCSIVAYSRKFHAKSSKGFILVQRSVDINVNCQLFNLEVEFIAIYSTILISSNFEVQQNLSIFKEKICLIGKYNELWTKYHIEKKSAELPPHSNCLHIKVSTL